MVADGSVGSGSSLSGLPIAEIRSVPFYACCGISHIVVVFGLSFVDLISVHGVRYENSFRCSFVL